MMHPTGAQARVQGISYGAVVWALTCVKGSLDYGPPFSGEFILVFQGVYEDPDLGAHPRGPCGRPRTEGQVVAFWCRPLPPYAMEKGDHRKRRGKGLLNGSTMIELREGWNMTALRPQIRERRTTSINHPTSIFQVLGAYCHTVYHAVSYYTMIYYAIHPASMFQLSEVYCTPDCPMSILNRARVSININFSSSATQSLGDGGVDLPELVLVLFHDLPSKQAHINQQI